LKSISWKIIAEFGGAAAIVASLVFVGLQLRQELRVASVEIGFNLVESFYEQRNGTIENAAIWVKGNAGIDDLSPAETAIYEALIRKGWAHAYWTDLTMRELLGEDYVGIHDFAGFLHRNPGARRSWKALMAIEQNYREKLISEPIGVDMMNIVLADLEKLDQVDSP
jgi:hypothetical protein